eukprot:CAMPEP_0115003528 /NCGR_PEP_ID=MMETSP0216-20121206/18667_1 /TAXON_ID=223996 /ORGANISM="Protocruzia adherens, Strain Boccale" /LENGTH=996 /DNA_ID=CAMNT_0002369355 /DNA_START=169 /DNA_END=3159 /DNA_ORIENTATION=-
MEVFGSPRSDDYGMLAARPTDLKRCETLFDDWLEKLSETRSHSMSLDDLHEYISIEGSSLKSKLTELMTEILERLDEKSNSITELKEKIITSEGQFQQERDLMNQQLEFTRNQLTEATQKEIQLRNQVKESITDKNERIKELTHQYEEKMSTLHEEVAGLTDNLQQSEIKYSECERQFDYKIVQATQEIDELKTSALNLSSENDLLKSKLESFEEENAVKMESVKQNYDQELSDAKSAGDLKQSQLDELRDELKQLETAQAKESAVYKQKVEFLQLQLDEKEMQLEESKSSHEAMVRMWEKRSQETEQGAQEVSKQLNEMKDLHLQEIEELEKNNENSRRTLNQKIEKLTEDFQEKELELRLQQSDYERKISTLDDQIESLEELKGRLQEQNKALETKTTLSLDEAEKRYSARITEMEERLNSREADVDKELHVMQKNSSEQIDQLKQFYEGEKTKLEERLALEKKKASDQIRVLTEDLEQKLKEEQEAHQEDVQCLQDEIRSIQLQADNEVMRFETSKELFEQRIEALQGQTKESKETLSNIQEMHKTHTQELQQSSNKEKDILTSRCKELSEELGGKTKELNQTKCQVEYLEESMQLKADQLAQVKKDFATERTELSERCTEANARCQEMAEESARRVVVLEKDKAILEQKNEFVEKKLADTEAKVEEFNKKYEEKVSLEDRANKYFAREIELKEKEVRELSARSQELWEVYVEKSYAIQCKRCGKTELTEKFKDHASQEKCIFEIAHLNQRPYDRLSEAASYKYFDNKENSKLTQGPLYITIPDWRESKSGDTIAREYSIEVEDGSGKKWCIYRNLRMVLGLQSEVSQAHKLIKMPTSVKTLKKLAYETIDNPHLHHGRPFQCTQAQKEAIRCAIQQFLNDLAKIPEVRDSLEFQIFLSVGLEASRSSSTYSLAFRSEKVTNVSKSESNGMKSSGASTSRDLPLKSSRYGSNFRNEGKSSRNADLPKRIDAKKKGLSNRSIDRSGFNTDRGKY